MIQDQLLAIINSYNSDGYYKYKNIPSSKLQSAVQNYPVDPSDIPLALIDTTIFGSAKTGMVIGLKGIYFKNDWTTKTEKNFITWHELSNSHSTISGGALNCILLIPGCEINMSGSSMKKNLLINLLNQIIALYQELPNIEPQEINPEKKPIYTPHTASIEHTDNNDNAKLYSELVPELIALCMSADGELEDQETELATAIIENDDLIQDKQTALESLTLNTERLILDKIKSNSIFKLKSTTITSKLSKIHDPHQKERIQYILEGMLESVGEKGFAETKLMIDSMLKKL